MVEGIVGKAVPSGDQEGMKVVGECGLLTDDGTGVGVDVYSWSPPPPSPLARISAPSAGNQAGACRRGAQLYWPVAASTMCSIPPTLYAIRPETGRVGGGGKSSPRGCGRRRARRSWLGPARLAHGAAAYRWVPGPVCRWAEACRVGSGMGVCRLGGAVWVGAASWTAASHWRVGAHGRWRCW